MTRIQGKLACAQTKCTWILPTYVREVPYSKVREIDFSSAKKLKNTMDQRIDSQRPNLGEQQENLAEKDDQSKPIAFLSEEEMQAVYAKLKLKCLQN